MIVICTRSQRATTVICVLHKNSWAAEESKRWGRQALALVQRMVDCSKVVPCYSVSRDVVTRWCKPQEWLEEVGMLAKQYRNHKLKLTGMLWQ